VAAAALALSVALTTGMPAAAYQAGLCAVPTKQVGFLDCSTGDESSNISVALIGDSHTRSWFGPARALAAKYDWKLTTVSKSACPPLDPAMMPTVLTSKTCLPWNQKLQSYLKGNPGFDLVINASSSFVTKGYQSYAKSFASVAKLMTANGAVLLVIRDNPKPKPSFLACIANNPKAIDAACSVTRAKALTPNDPMPAAVKGMANVKTVDFTDAYCNAQTCSPKIDGIVVYRDHSHISAEWAMHLTGLLEQAIPARFKQ